MDHGKQPLESMTGLSPVGRLTSHEPATSLSCHPSPVRSTDSDDSDDSVDGSDRSSVIRDLDQSYTIILEMHG